jgi:hypothetical protein
LQLSIEETHLVVEAALLNLLNVLLGMTLSALTVNEVQTAGLNLTVDEGTSETGHDLLGLLVARGLAWCREGLLVWVFLDGE